MGGFTFTEEAAMVYPDLADEIDKLIQELDAKIKALHALKIDKEGEWKEWDVRVEIISRIRLFEKDLIRLKESFKNP
jgi:hypothetical protein